MKMLKNRLKVISIFICIMLLLNVFTACGTKEKESVAVKENLSAKEEKVESKEVAKSEEKVDLSTKKVVIIKQLEILGLNEAEAKSVELFESEGVKSENITKFLNLPDQVAKVDELIASIKEIQPDVITLLPGIPGKLRSTLATMNIPVITSNAEWDCDENGMPKANITGVRSMPPDLTTRLYKMLNTFAPIDNKQVGFITNAASAQLDYVNSAEDNLKKLNIKTKEYVVVKTVEEALEYADKFGKDDEIGWVLVGMMPEVDSKGKTVDILETLNKVLTIAKKPSAAMVEAYVAKGALCGMTVDDVGAFGEQMTKMGVEILKGTKVNEMKMQDIEKVNVFFNKKTADDLKIKIPDDFIMAAYRVYTDYNFQYAGSSKE